MAFRPIQWARQTIEGRQAEADGSRLFNFYAVRAVTPEESKVPVIIYGTPGHRAWARVPAEEFDQGGVDVTPPVGIYGLIENNSPTRGNRLFGVSSEYQFFEIDVPETYDPIRKDPPDPLHVVPLADIHNFTEEIAQRVTRPVHMVTDGRRIVWVTSREVLMWDIDANAGAGGFVALTAPIPADMSRSLPDEDWVDCEWIDGYFILAARGGQFFHSLNNAQEFDQLDFAFALAKPDEIVGIRAFQRRIYIFGSESIEQWGNVGARDFAFRRDNTFIADVGCGARATIQATDVGIFFVGNDRIVYGIAGSSLLRFSNESVEFDLAKCVLEQCHAFEYTEEGHRFYSLSMYGDFGEDEDDNAVTEKNWTLDITTRLWHERGLIGVYAAAYFRNRFFVGMPDQAEIFEASLNFGDANGVAIERIATTPILHAEQHRVQFPLFLADIPLRPSDEIDPDDTVRLEWSDNGKRDWQGSGRPAKALVGQARYQWRQLGQTNQRERSRHFRLIANAKRRVDVLGAYVDADVGAL